ncbi:U-box domain-containing protein 19 [Brachypodium distachyon]|uniref:RING-type E3 ubiquitin transferase n=1 Tax=Brachypodium distachyon TaxID=15368 RepID=I1I715_BRADI|nr:U-box domain-containing protein 19 [Brachypodium distachyon]PNT68096.1 hypothetical protein BRADI_3g35830v3 [Brachypodium distachyon]|eukprot:XP_014755825.1 U-box domain-containing protein 19 [Brachypodium distachyon]
MQPHERRAAPGRRMLALPAVCPCEAIQPGPLLASLLTLVADVSGRDASAFPALRRGAGDAVRIAGVLLAFLEEISESAALPVAAVLGLSELHVATQKLRFLLADCARKGARLWVLMNAELVASELRFVLGSVATAMDVLPADVAAASVEAEELARLVSEQAWCAARVRPDADDARAAWSVRSMLAQFKGGATPDAEDARMVLGRVGITSWWLCAEEAAFLEAELMERLEDGREDDNDLVLISGLMAFLVYCRVVLFDRVDSKNAPAAASQDSPAAASCGATWTGSQDALLCPITLELMSDPVTVSTGQTYDRASIKRWVKSGCRTCPVTGERLRSAELVPNLAARGIIEQLLLSRNALHEPPSNKHRNAVDKTVAAFGPAAAGGVRLAAAFLVSRLSRGNGTSTTTEEQRKATQEVRKLAKRNVFHRACLVDAGAVPWLLHLLSSPDASVQENAVASLLNLSKHPAGRAALVEAGGLGLVVDAVNVAAKAEARQNAAAVLFYLSSNGSENYCQEISRIPEAIPTLVCLMREGAYRGRKNALVSLYGVLQNSSNNSQRSSVSVGKAVSAGAVGVLAGLVLSGSGDREDLASDAVALLARIAEQPAGASAVLAIPELVEGLVGFLGACASRSGKDHCVALLASLCRHGGDGVVALMGKMPALMPALYALVAEGGGVGAKRARWLVNEIHRVYDQRQLPAVAQPAGDRAIRVQHTNFVS